MNDREGTRSDEPQHPVALEVTSPGDERNRLTTFFRVVLALPHIFLVGGPLGAFLSMSGGEEGMNSVGSGGLLGAVAFLCAVFAWFAILATRRHPEGLWKLAAFYLRWRVNAVAYVALLRDEYPPFGEGDYPLYLQLPQPRGDRDRLSVAIRLILALPHIFLVCALGIVWMFTTFIAWFAILITGRYPIELFAFGVGVLRWQTRVEAYLLLLTDEYPPFSLA